MIQIPKNSPRNGDGVSQRPEKLKTFTAKYCVALLDRLKQQLVCK
jgi:hypothetical protein